MSKRELLVVTVALLLIAALAVGGYAIGSSSAPDASDARASHTDGYRTAYSSALVVARDRAHNRALKQGLARGRESGDAAGTSAGGHAGQGDAAAELAAAQPAAPTPPASGLTYTDELPSGRPGYVLPIEQRTLGCVGYDAETGQCVGD